MQKEIAKILKDKIFDLPFIELIAGLTQPVSYQDKDANNEFRKVILPMAYDITDKTETAAECSVGKERDLVPNSDRKSIFYFEEIATGKISGTGRPGSNSMQTTIRLVGWLNKQKLFGDNYANIASFVNTAILSRLVRKNPINEGNIKRLSISVAGFPKPDANLFSKYTYDETIRQFLMPPFECTAIDFICKYEISAACLIVPDWEGGNLC